MIRRASSPRTKAPRVSLWLMTVFLFAFSTSSIGCGGGAPIFEDRQDSGESEEEEDIDGGPDGTEECTENCAKTCTKNSQCDDGDPCNGDEICDLSAKRCAAGTPLEDGTACGTAMACHAGVCGGIVCGDGYVDEGEECDDGNTVNGDGCDSCRFSCVIGVPERGCPADACNEPGVCNDDHTCGAGVPKADETACGSAMVCRAGVCLDAECGNGIVEPGEDCDFGAANGTGSGCENDCSFSCASAADCDDAEACNGVETCEEVSVNGAIGKKCQAGTALDEGDACSEDDEEMTCKEGGCASPDCGDGVLDPGEDCDLGDANGPGVGCEKTCKFSCDPDVADSCNDGNLCTVKTCEPTDVSGETLYKCSAASPVADCTECGGGVCQNGACAASTCGDGCIDPRKGETCEPPGSPGCDASCHAPPVCGNGRREVGEQCDDGNTLNLDGCDSECRFEQVHRINHLKMQWAKDAGFCPKNALGGAIASAGQGTIADALDGGVKDGSVSILFKFLGLADLTGTSASNLRLGAMNASPVKTAGYDGSNDLDWWYVADAGNIDADRDPTAFLDGGITAKKLEAGPGNITLNIVLAGSVAPLSLSNTKVEVTLGKSSEPTISTGAAPGHLASMMLDPALVSFDSGGERTNNSTGKLCGYVSAYSLSLVPVPEALTTGLTKCGEGYTVANNSLLDVIVNGCAAMGFIKVIHKTQPDQASASAAPVGAGGPYKLSIDSGTKKVTGCKDKGDATVDLDQCLEAAAYSSFFKFATGRVIAKAP